MRPHSNTNTDIPEPLEDPRSSSARSAETSTSDQNRNQNQNQSENQNQNQTQSKNQNQNQTQNQTQTQVQVFPWSGRHRVFEAERLDMIRGRFARHEEEQHIGLVVMSHFKGRRRHLASPYALRV
ncbi:hypothetical protein EYF80_058444 [Liparis tanakae]|uniref:Uncharacterized protein n=1 Tax=Liparis tanakae TaxID=230148 RepID=A0A4Z2ERD0_9TELE|nr:hypothetical protein EYF80_058444 [Liparis tanakae]